MDNKFYVSYEAARLLKEKGYDEKVEYMYDDNILTSIDVLTNSQIDRYYRNMYGVEFYGAPTKAEAIDWLESKGMVVIVDISLSDEIWIYSIYREGEHVYDSIISKESHLPTRWEAKDAAIIKALELL